VPRCFSKCKTRTGKERLTWRGSSWRRSGGRRLVVAHEGRPCSLFTVEPGLLAVVAACFRRGCRRNRKWWPTGWSMFLLCFSCCWKGRMTSTDSATAAEERCGFCWFHLVLNVIRRGWAEGEKRMNGEPFLGGCVGCVDREGRPVNGVTVVAGWGSEVWRRGCNR